LRSRESCARCGAPSGIAVPAVRPQPFVRPRDHRLCRGDIVISAGGRGFHIDNHTVCADALDLLACHSALAIEVREALANEEADATWKRLTLAEAALDQEADQ
jgi:hypothetical protein